MTTNKIAKIIGVFFIIATVVNIAGSRIVGSVLDSPDWLSLISVNAAPIKTGSLLLFISALASVSIAVWLYPVLKKYNPFLALTAVVFRTIEAVFYIISAAGSLSLITLGQEYLAAGSPANSHFQSLGNYLLNAGDAAGFVFAVLAFIPAGLAYYFIFYRTKLVPRWLSAWGILSCLTLLLAVLIAIFNGPPFAVSGRSMFLAAPIFLQEMVLAVWLITKGFNKNLKDSV